MKTICTTIIALVAILAVGCSGKTNTEAAADSTYENLITVDSLLSNAANLTDSLVAVEGVCTHTCRHGAKKMFIVGTDDSNTIRVEACELGAFKPEVVNSHVYVKGYLREQRIDEQYLVDWEDTLKANEAEDVSGGSGAGCETERNARGVESVYANEQIAEYRDKIARQVEAGGNPWLSFYYIDATDYCIDED